MDVHKTKKKKSTMIQLSMKASPELTQGLATTLHFHSFFPPRNILKHKFNNMDLTKCDSIS